MKLRVAGLISGVVTLATLMVPAVSASRYTSPNYTIDASVGSNSLGVQSATGSYQLYASGGESIIGNGQGGSYILEQGYVAQLPRSITVSATPNPVSFPTIISGTSQQSTSTVSVLTDAPGYTLAISQNIDLTKSGDTIPGVSASLASPSVWNEGTTKGLGLSVASASATAPDGKWQSGDAFGALTSSPTTIYSRSGFSGGAQDTIALRYRIDVSATQASGAYTNTVTVTGTANP